MTTDPKEIASKLSETMKRAVLTMNSRPTCAYRLRVGLGTLEALRARNLVRKIAHPGSLFSPQTGIDWWLTDVGALVRAELEASNGEG